MPLFVRHKKPASLKPKANPYTSRFQTWRHTLSVTFILIIIIGGVFRFYPPFYKVFEQQLFEGSAWVQRAFIRPFHETRALLNDTHTITHLKEEYQLLKEENEMLKWQLQNLKPLYHENAVLREALKIPAFEKYGHFTARVLSSPYDGLHHFFLIDAGEQDGLEKDQAVISHKGVVGRIEKVGEHVSRVLFLNDPNSRVPVMTSMSEQKAILAGDGSFHPTLVYVSDFRQIQQGEKVVTSGLGGIFPAGLPVGVVDEIKNGKIRVKLYVPFHSLEWVHVLQNNPEGFTEEFNKELEGE